MNEFMIKKTKEFGINNNIQKKICDKIGINNKKNFLKLKSNLLVKTETFLKKQQISKGKILKESIKKNIEFLIELKNYKGIRHKLKYPVRGQRTHTNAQTRIKFKI